jgi:hypothetical protein
MARSWSNRSRMPVFTMSLSSTKPRTRSPSATASGAPPCAAMPSLMYSTGGGTWPVPLLEHPAAHGVGGALADGPPVEVHPAHARLRAERHQPRAVQGAGEPEALVGEADDVSVSGRVAATRQNVQIIGDYARRCPRARRGCWPSWVKPRSAAGGWVARVESAPEVNDHLHALEAHGPVVVARVSGGTRAW